MTATTDSIVHKHPHTAFAYSQLCHFPLVNQYIFNQPSPVLKAVASRPGVCFCVHILCAYCVLSIYSSYFVSFPSRCCIFGRGKLCFCVRIVCATFVLSRCSSLGSFPSRCSIFGRGKLYFGLYHSLCGYCVYSLCAVTSSGSFCNYLLNIM